MRPSDALHVVSAWQEASNAQDVDRLLALSDSNIELVGPRGSGFGHQLLREWLGRAGLMLTTQRAFARASGVVLEQHGIWHAPETGQVIGEKTLASTFVVSDRGQVTRFARYDSLQEALDAAGLDLADEVR